MSISLFMPQSPPDSQRPRPKRSGYRAEAKWDEPEPLIGGVVDLGAIATEFLILGLDPYPRKPGVVFEPPQDLKPDGGPFAAPCRTGRRTGMTPDRSCVRTPNRYCRVRFQLPDFWT